MLITLLILVCFSSRNLMFLINKRLSFYNDTSNCPASYRLANLDNLEDWNRAGQLAFEKLGANKIAWIRSGLGFKGLGNERWSLITQKRQSDCNNFPPKSLKSFCVPFKRPRLSPDLINSKFPSICEKVEAE